MNDQDHLQGKLHDPDAQAQFRSQIVRRAYRDAAGIEAQGDPKGIAGKIRAGLHKMTNPNDRPR